MLLLRILSTALCAACVVLLATFQPVRLAVLPCAVHRGPPCARVGEPAVPVDRGGPPAGVPVQVVDVAPGVPPAQIAALIQLRPDEHVSAVNDRAPASDLEVGALIATRPRPGEFLDLTVSSPTRERRVLVLLHEPPPALAPAAAPLAR